MRVTTNFQLKKSKAREGGKCPVYLRCTLNGERFELSTGIFVSPELWNNNRQEPKGNDEEARAIRSRLVRIRSKVQNAYTQLETSENHFSALDLKQKLQEKHARIGLIALFDFVIKDMEARLGIDYSEGTIKHYKTTRERLQEFLKIQFKRQEVSVGTVDYSFLKAMDTFLKQRYRIKTNTAVTYHKHLKKVLNTAIASNYISTNPYERFKIVRTNGHRDYLNWQELDLIKSGKFKTRRLALVRDLFLFACYTGLGYAELSKLSREHIHAGDDGNDWIIIDRNKTDARCRIPLLNEPKKILRQYKGLPECEVTGKLLPVNSNQKMNEYLKEIADVCGINKNLSMHVARHTFATTVTLTSGVPIETVSKMLGHASIRTTQIYAKILDAKIAEDMKMVGRRKQL